MSRGGRPARFAPRWWDHQRHVLAALRRTLERVVAEHLELAPGERVVDLGCGDSPYRAWFDDAGADYVRCDLAPAGEVDVRLEPGRPVALPDGCAAGVVSFQVLEHVWDLDWYLGEARRLLRPGGWLLLSTHGTWPYHPHPTDYRRWTRTGLIEELGTRGFEIDLVEAVVGPLAWTTQIRLLGWRELLSRIPVVGGLLFKPLAVLTNLRMVLEDVVTPESIRRYNGCVYVTLSHKPGDDMAD